MLIYLLRHGDASNESRYQDSERPLTERGEKQASIVGTFLQQINSQIEIVLHSPLKRAQQTAFIVNSKISSKIIISTEYLVNGTDQRQLIQQINKLETNSVLLVGHIPHLSDTISLLINGNYDDDIELKKCSLAIVDIDKPINPGTGKLKQLIHTSEMEKSSN